jgi:hypothetical protein
MKNIDPAEVEKPICIMPGPSRPAAENSLQEAAIRKTSNA